MPTVKSINDVTVVETDPVYVAEKGTANGAATLDGTGNVPLAQLGNAPSGGGDASAMLLRAKRTASGSVTTSAVVETLDSVSAIAGTAGSLVVLMGRILIKSLDIFGTTPNFFRFEATILLNGSPIGGGVPTQDWVGDLSGNEPAPPDTAWVPFHVVLGQLPASATLGVSMVAAFGSTPGLSYDLSLSAFEVVGSGGGGGS